MSVFSTGTLAAVFILASVAAGSAAPDRMLRDQSGAWHAQDQSGMWRQYDRSQRTPIAAPPARMMPFTFEEQQTFDRAQGDLG